MCRLRRLDRKGQVPLQEQNRDDGLKTENSRFESTRIHVRLSNGLVGVVVHFIPVTGVFTASSREIQPSRSSMMRLL